MSKQRFAATRVIIYLGMAGAFIAGGANVWLALQTGAWQMWLVVIGEILAISGLSVAYRLAKRGRFDEAGYLSVASIFFAVGSGELANTGLTIYLLISGILMIVLVGGMIMPRRWYYWLPAVALFGGLFWLIEHFEPLPRFDVRGISSFQGLIVTILALIVVIGIWQFIRVLRFGTIRARLLTGFVSLVLLPAVVIGAGSSYLSAQNSIQNVLYQLQSVSELKENEVKAWIESLYTNLELAMPSSDVVSLTEMILKEPEATDVEFYQVNYDREKRRFDQIITQSRVFTEIFMVAPNGTVMLSTDRNHVGRNELGYDYFNAGLVQSTITAPFEYPYTNQKTIMAVAPIINLDGETVGVLAAQANIDSLSVIMLERAGLGESGEAYLISDRDQRLMTASIDPEWQPGDYLFSDAIIKSALEGLNGSGNYSNYKGVAVYGAYRSLPELGMSLIIEQEQTEVLAPIVRIIIIIAGTSILATLFSIVIALLVTNRITQPIAGLANTAEQIATGNLNLLARVEQEDEIGALAVSFNTMTTQLRQTLEGLEGQVRDRTAALEQRSAYLQASADISRAVSSVLDPDQLIQQVVELIKERFNLYYVGLFLLDEAGELAVLRAGTGEAGRVMIQKGHQLKVGSGMIGWSIANQRSRIAQHAELDASRLANPNLPDTRSEAAIPLRSRGRVIGALTIQSDRLDAFDEATIVVFETMGDQVAVALDNARLFRESQQTLESLRQAYGEITREGWKRLLKESPELGYRSDASGRISQVQDGDRWLHEMELAFDEERSVQGLIEEAAATSEHDSESQEGSSVTGLSEYYLSVPLKVRENLIGVFTAYKPIERGGWNAEEIAFMEEVVDDISVALESARFFSEAQARAETERLITEVSGRIRQTLDIDTVLQVAAREMQQALDLAEVEIHLGGVSDVAAHGAETPRPTKSSDGGKEEV